MNQQVTSARIMQIGMGFWASKTLLSAVELSLFTELAKGPQTANAIQAAVGMHPRATYDFLDALVSVGLLERDGNGPDARYSNTPETGRFLDRNSPLYVGGFLEMANARLYPFWAALTEALKTGKPQNEIKHSGKPMFDELYSDPARLEQFMDAMSGVSLANFHAFADKFDFSRYRSLADIGGATGLLSCIVAERHPHMTCSTYDLAAVQPIAERRINRAGLKGRVTACALDFLTIFPRRT